MKRISKIIGNVVCLVTIICLSQCKSPEPQAQEVASTDTITKTDSVQTVLKSDTGTVAKQVPLTLTISNLATKTGPVIVGVYGVKNKFPDPKGQLKEYKFTPDSLSFKAQITDLPFGEYALAIYQDVNNNGKIDKNMIGIPTEPYAFSNNYKPTLKAPGFKNCRFLYTASSNAITMKMIR